MAKAPRHHHRKVIRQAEFIGKDFDKLRLGLVEDVSNGFIEFRFPTQCPKCGGALCVEVGKTGHKQFELDREGGYGKEIENVDDPFWESPELFCSNEDCDFEFRIEELGDQNDQKTKTYEKGD